MRLKICSEPGCKALIPESGPARCEKHQPAPFVGAVRSNERLYNTSRWKKIRAYIIKRDGCCSVCGETSNLHVDHIRPPRGEEYLFYNIDNLCVKCASCHSKKTNQEIIERRKNANI